MGELLSFDDLEQGFTTPDSKRYPEQLVAIENAVQLQQGVWHDLHAKGAKFLIKISHPVFAEIEMSAFLTEPICYVNKEKNRGRLYGIEADEVMSEYTINPVSESRQAYYESSLPEDTSVLLMELTQNTLPNADTI